MAKSDTRLGQRIRERREMLGWSKAKLGRLAGMHASQVGRFESGERALTEDHMVSIAGALGWSPERFFSTDSNVIEASPDTRRVPLLDYVQVGQWHEHLEVSDGAQTAQTVTVSIATPTSSFAMRVRGNSMEPLFLADDIIVIAPSIHPEPGDYTVATNDLGEATFRKYREVGLDDRGNKVIELVPVNPDYPTIRSDRQQFAIVGKMIRQMREYHRI